MSQEFRGFTIETPIPGDLYDLFRFAEEANRFCAAILTRLGVRIAASRWNAGWDQRPGRDYFYGNFETNARGRPDPFFLGLYHYRQPERFAGSRFQVWAWEHDDEPIVDIPVAKLLADVSEATKSGRLGDYLSARADEIKRELGLH